MGLFHCLKMAPAARGHIYFKQTRKNPHHHRVVVLLIINASHLQPHRQLAIEIRNPMLWQPSRCFALSQLAHVLAAESRPIGAGDGDEPSRRGEPLPASAAGIND